MRRNQADVKKRLEDLMALNGEIDQSQKKIEGIEKDIHHIDGNIGYSAIWPIGSRIGCYEHFDKSGFDEVIQLLKLLRR